MPGKYVEMKRGGTTLHPTNDVEIIGGAFQFTEKIGLMVGHRAQYRGVFLAGGISCAARQKPARIVNFSRDESAGDSGGAFEGVRGPMLGTAKHDRAAWHAFDPSLEPPPVCEKTD